MASSKKSERNWWLAVLFVALAGLAVGLAILFSSNDGRGAGPRVHPTSTVADEKAVPPTPVPQPATAEEIAAQLHCVGFTSRPGGGLGGTVSAGNCFIGGQKFAINTFASTQARDSWLVATEQLGVVPWKETPTAVIYPSVTGG